MVQARRREGDPADVSELGSDDLVVHLVPMRRRHLRSVLRIEAQVYPRPWSLGLFMSELALRNTRAYYVARVDGVVVGYGGLMVSGDDGHITTLAVDPTWHRRKIASRLLLALVREGVSRGVASLTLEVRVGNIAAQELYRQFGFAPAGIRKNYYVETNEDALVMWAHDVDGAEYGRRLERIEAGVPGITLLHDGRSLDDGSDLPGGAGDTGRPRP
ncbi:MAG: [ribosomal protein S18]-alanine N-acetyltransferase [Actinomycetota bacterium]|jgi:ribosomal-protein-alanine N-acetyltransferase|nr:[ribosomal protein S18]-alanine N-acetyltransferase [Actinomycetota bacterium]MEA2931946.1 [ribosomal protein S18]-alanine N-acetyltransferase [Actinomycetota bacterium]